ncbi:MAG: YqgE/AlgH family protein, partial [Pirellulales bacterium]|nr:YqgE/AlgH family protein [Pirellulales bacterium]
LGPDFGDEVGIARTRLRLNRRVRGMKSLRGQLLVATPRLPDENFFRTVVLMVEHTDQGALGVVLNRLAEQSVEQLWSEVSEASCSSTRKVNLGGPVSGPLLAVHTDQRLAELEILAGLYLAAQKDHLDQLVQQETHRWRVFLGHAGWGGGQLESELEQGAWLVTPATKEYVFHRAEDLWETVAKHIGDTVLLESLNIKHLPQDPSVN